MSRFCVNALGRIHILQLNTGAKCEYDIQKIKMAWFTIRVRGLIKKLF